MSSLSPREQIEDEVAKPTGQTDLSAEELSGVRDEIEADLIAVQADRDTALGEIDDRYRQKLTDLRDQVATAERLLCDARAAQALVGRPDAQEVAGRLGLTLPQGDG